MNAISSLGLTIAVLSALDANAEIGNITEIAAATTEFCDQLPTANAGDQDLRAQASTFPSATCGRYKVTCPNVDDMTYFTLDVPAIGAERGRVVSLSGSRGRYFHTENVAEYVAGGLHTLVVAYEMSAQDGWPCAKDECPDYVSPTEPGVREAGCRPATIIHSFQAAGEPLCAQGHSTGSSAVSFALAWYGGGDWLDYVQLTGWNPLSRIDYGCDPARSGISRGVRSYVGKNPSGATQNVSNRPFAYDSTASYARETMDDIGGLPDGTCGAHPTPGVSDEQAARLYASSLTAPGAVYTYPQTVIDHYACLAPKSVTDGNGSWWLEQVQAANPGRVFMQGLSAGNVFNKQCSVEEVWWKGDGRTPSPIRQLTIDRMLQQCVLRHTP